MTTEAEEPIEKFRALTSKLLALLLFSGVRPSLLDMGALDAHIVEFFKRRMGVTASPPSLDVEAVSGPEQDLGRLVDAAVEWDEKDIQRRKRLKTLLNTKPVDKDAVLRIAAELCGVEDEDEEKGHRTDTRFH